MATTRRKSRCIEVAPKCRMRPHALYASEALCRLIMLPLGRVGSERTNHWRADLHPFRIRELFQHRFKSRIRFTNAFGVLNNGFAISEETRYGKRHCDAMIAETRHPRTVQGAGPEISRPSFSSATCVPMARIVRDCGDAITFFYAHSSA